MAKTESVGQLSEFRSPTAAPEESRLYASDNQLIVSADLFARTLAGLQERSADYRESAAIWAGTITGGEWYAERVFFHHDLCDDHGGPLFLELSEKAKFNLYRQLGQEKRSLVALLHTHPEKWVGLSPIDQRNQLCSRLGFWSIVIPHYAQEPHVLSEMGVHVRTNDGWYQLEAGQIATRMIVAI